MPPSRPHTRRVLTILALLLAGAVINVLVAWACARWLDGGRSGVVRGIAHPASIPPLANVYINDPQYLKSFGYDRAPEDEEGQDIRDLSQPRPGQRATGLKWEEYRTIFCTRIIYARWFDSEFAYARMHSIAQFGLPMRSLEVAQRSHLNIAAYSGGDSWRLAGWAGGWPLESSERQGFFVPHVQSIHIYPLTPIPLGFAANTLFYAALLFALFLASRTLRRHLRRRRGLCLKCAYPIGTSPVCTECGTPISSAAPRNAT